MKTYFGFVTGHKVRLIYYRPLPKLGQCLCQRLRGMKEMSKYCLWSIVSVLLISFNGVCRNDLQVHCCYDLREKKSPKLSLFSSSLFGTTAFSIATTSWSSVPLPAEKLKNNGIYYEYDFFLTKKNGFVCAVEIIPSVPRLPLLFTLWSPVSLPSEQQWNSKIK